MHSPRLLEEIPRARGGFDRRPIRYKQEEEHQMARRRQRNRDMIPLSMYEILIDLLFIGLVLMVMGILPFPLEIF